MENLSSANNEENATPNGYVIKGVDLQIDQHTQVLCETYNRSSGTTRSVLYVLLLVNVITLIAVFNSNWRFNWTNDRLKIYDDSINFKQRKLYSENYFFKKAAKIDSLKKDSLKFYKGKALDSAKSKAAEYSKRDSEQYFKVNGIKQQIDFAKRQRDALEKSAIDNYYMIKVNFIGIAFDINDLGSISGIALILLLIVLRFTITREKNNVKIAFNSITERYPQGADKKYFNEYFDSIFKSPSASGKAGEKETDVPDEWESKLADINYVRRRYHYNFLSMNEVFNLPKLSVSRNITQTKPMGKIINEYLFYFPLVIYSYALLNDMTTLTLADNLSDHHTIVIESASCICFIFVANLCKACVDQKTAVMNLFKNFYDKNYVYDHGTYDGRPYRLIVKLIIPLLLLLALFGFSMLLNGLLKAF